jgi:hypothetical protein
MAQNLPSMPPNQKAVDAVASLRWRCVGCWRLWKPCGWS